MHYGYYYRYQSLVCYGLYIITVFKVYFVMGCILLLLSWFSLLCNSCIIGIINVIKVKFVMGYILLPISRFSLLWGAYYNRYHGLVCYDKNSCIMGIITVIKV